MNALDFSFLWPILTRATLHGTVALVAVFVICRLFHSIPAATKCWLWRLAWLRVFAAFMTGAGFSLPLLPAPEPITMPAGAATLPAPIAARPVPTADDVAPVRAITATQALTLIWAIGAALMILRLAFHYSAAVQLRRRAIARHSDLLPALSAAFKTRAPSLLISNEITKPLLTGIFKPAIILPPCLSGADPRKLELIFKHELAHLKRRDLAWNWLAAIAHTLFWFNPLTWLCEREANFSQEVACDELALRGETTRAAEFAALLVDVAANRERAPQLLTVSIIRTRNTLERRLKAMKPLHKKRSFISIALAALVLTPAIVPWRAVAQKSSEPTATAEEPKPESPATNTVTEEELLADEIKLATKELNATARARESGNAGFADVVQRQRELLRLERELGMLRKDTTKVRKALRDELLAVESLQKQAATQVEAGVMASSEKLKIDREALQLKRELAAFDRGQPQAEASGDGAVPNMTMMYYMSNPELMKRYFPQMYARMITSGQTNWVQTGASGANKTLATTDDELRAARDQLALLQLKYTDQHPEVVESKNRIAMLEKSQPSAQSSLQARLNETARARIALRPKRPGVVTEVLVRGGDHVKAGTALVQLDNREAQLRLRAAESEFAIADADTQLQTKALSVERKQIENSLGGDENKRSNFEIIDLKLTRLKHQLELTRTKFDQARLDYDDLTIRAPAAGSIGFLPIVGQTVAPENQAVEFLPDLPSEKR